jgi:hypothetical protein
MPKELESQEYEQVDTTEDGTPQRRKSFAFGFSKKTDRASVSDAEQMKKEKEKTAPKDLPKEEMDEHAFNNIDKAQWMIKLMAIFQDPSRIREILNAKNFQQGLEEHYGTDDPMKVSEIVLHDLQDAIRNGTWSIGRLAFFGGAYACFAGLLQFMPPMGILMCATPIGMLNIIFMMIFGLVTMTIESSGDTISATFKANIMKYCAALDEIWGRGFFYMYMGITQILAPRERKFGWYMFFVGIVYLIIYHQTNKHIDTLSSMFNDPTELERVFDEYAGVDKVLNRDELCKLLKSLDLDLSHAEMEMMMKRLDPDHDGYVTLSELKEALKDHTKAHSAYYTIGPVPKLDPTKGDKLTINATKKKPKMGGIFGLGGETDETGKDVMDWNKIKMAI